MEIIEKPICRLCLGDEPTIQIFHEETKLYEKIILCCDIQVEENDVFPKQICAICMTSITKAIDFRLMCESNEQILREKYFFSNNTDDCHNYDYEMQPGSIEIKVIDNLKHEEKDKMEENSQNYKDSSVFNSKNIKKKNCTKEKRKRVHNINGSYPDKFGNMQIKDSNNEDLFCCICDVDLTKYNVQRHPLSCDDEKKYMCDNCNLSFECKATLTDQGKAYSNVVIFPCTICDKTFKYKKYLRKHINRCHFNIGKFQCDICKKMFCSKSSVKRHLRTHSKPVLQCEICNQVLKYKEAYERHMLYHSKDIDELRDNINTQKPIMKRQEVMVVCSYCGITIAKDKISAHLMSHSTVRSHQCDKCDRAFKCRARLKDHMSVHSDARPYSCTMCDLKFKQMCSLRLHIRKVHLNIKNAECDLCGKKFYSDVYLRRHMEYHRQELTHECEICHRMLRTKTSYEIHKLTHSGEKPWQCNICNSKFTTSKSLREHERLHTGERPYACPCCDKAFSQLSNMKSHFRNNHKDVNFDDVYKGKRMTKYV